VADASGAAVPGLTVTAANQATNLGYTGVTNEAGNYIITSVPISTYVIATKLQGFKSVQSTSDAVGRADGARRLHAGAGGT